MANAGTEGGPSGGGGAAASNNNLPAWVDALLFVRKVGAEGSSNSGATMLKSCFPEESLSPSVVEDILQTALSRPLKGTKLKEIKYMFRVRDKQQSAAGAGTASTGTAGKADFEGEPITSTTLFYNCYVFYRQELYASKDAKASVSAAGSADAVASFGSASDSKLMRQAIVVVSKWPFPQLAFRLLSKLDDGLVWTSDPTVLALSGGGSVSNYRDAADTSASSRDRDSDAMVGGTGSDSIGGVDSAAITSVLMTGFAQIAVWPHPKPGSQMYLHFLGELLQYTVAQDVLASYGVNLSLATAFASMNVVTLLGPLGLLQHIWGLWELIITGKSKPLALYRKLLMLFTVVAFI
jgi:hypothetical protein